MKTIYRYPILKSQYKFDEELGCFYTIIDLPYVVEDNIVLSAKDQIIKVDVIRDTPSIWSLVDDQTCNIRPIKIYIFGTGWGIPNRMNLKNYIGSFICGNIGEIYHCYVD